MATQKTYIQKTDEKDRKDEFGNHVTLFNKMQGVATKIKKEKILQNQWQQCQEKKQTTLYTELLGIRYEQIQQKTDILVDMMA